MTVKEAAEHTGKSAQIIYNCIHSGKPPAFQNGKNFEINISILQNSVIQTKKHLNILTFTKW